jgi:hypothetical protein
MSLKMLDNRKGGRADLLTSLTPPAGDLAFAGSDLVGGTAERGLWYSVHRTHFSLTPNTLLLRPSLMKATAYAEKAADYKTMVSRYLKGLPPEW